MAAEGKDTGRKGPPAAPASMGPRPDGRGRLAQCLVDCGQACARQWGRGRMAAEGPTPQRWACIASGVNGAAAGWPRKDFRVVPRDGQYVGVNGAAAGWPRKVFNPLVPRLFVILRQWGRGRMAAEGPRPARSLVRDHASMGPRPDGRGRLLPPRDRVGLRHASMGPRPDGRGRAPPSWMPIRPTSVNGAAAGWPRKVGSCWTRGPLHVASMGPRPDGRGRLHPATLEAYRKSCVNGAAAGWPRKGVPGHPHRRPEQASMGPRPDGRGRLLLIDRDLLPCRRQWGRGRMAAEGGPPGRAASDRGRWRQWGRGRMAAEGCPCPTSCGPTSCVNGAAAGWPRKGGGRLGGGGGCIRVNGAAAGWPRKAPPPSAALPSRPRVNGAAAGWPRKVRHTTRVRGMAPRVNGAAAGWPRKGRRGQWRLTWTSRVNGAAAGWPRKVVPQRPAHPSRPASMGPRPDGRGRGCANAAGRHVHGRVNGAAAGWPRKEPHVSHCAAHSSASMGPRPDGRGRRGRVGGKRDGHIASMGPRPDGRGRRARRGVWIAVLRCVNGAAAGWPRKAAQLVRGVDVHMVASMGPRPDGRGRGGGPLSAPLPPAASMGPRPDGRGRGAWE